MRELFAEMMTEQQKLNAMTNRLDQLGVRVSLSADASEEIRIGQLQDKHISINTNTRDTLGCTFTAAHLFGHLVQFLDYDRYAALTSRTKGPKPVTVDDAFRLAFYEYELEAFRIGKGLMLSCFNVDREMDSKYALFMDTDFEHYWHYISTGERGDAATFNAMLATAYLRWKDNLRVITPLPHPSTICLKHPAFVDII